MKIGDTVIVRNKGYEVLGEILMVGKDTLLVEPIHFITGSIYTNDSWGIINPDKVDVRYPTAEEAAKYFKYLV